MVKFPTDQQVSLDLSYKSYATNDDINNNSKTEDLRKEDTERLKTAARASISAGSSGEGGAKLKPTLSESEQSGTKNKDAEELLSGAGKKE